MLLKTEYFERDILFIFCYFLGYNLKIKIIMKILHSADIQVKNREENLVIGSVQTLNNIEEVLKSKEIDIYIISGDLTEYAEPTETERNMIYNHLSRCLQIESLKELVVIAGNHDLEKTKKQMQYNAGNNVINVFADLMGTLDFECTKKLKYFNKSQCYNSVFNNIEYYVYSLEDNMETNFESSNPNAIKICLYHGMIKEYVDLAKLPLRKDIYNSIPSIELFPQNSLICAGDIHLEQEITGLNNQLFIYPGSPMQHTHSEGSYYTISDNIVEKVAQDKIVKYYELSDEAIIVKENIALKNNINYITIEIDYKTNSDEVFKYLNELVLPIGKINNFIKVKSSNLYLQFEEKIKLILLEKFNLQETNVKISFDYNKFVKLNVSNNPVVQSVIEEKINSMQSDETETKLQTSNDINLNSDKIDNLILNDVQLNKLFKSVLNNQLYNMKDSNIEQSELESDIIALFNEQLNLAFENNAKHFNIQLEYAETNGFMALTANRIMLNIPGIIRILGTNGIGKTTLYNMIRWVIKGEVYNGMSKANVVKNNLVVFNKYNHDIDIVTVKLSFLVNTTQIYITRSVERKWKNNVTDEQKLSLKWKNYVSTVDRNFKLELVQKDGTIKTYEGEQAEKTVLIWFGETIDNILVLNQNKIETLLKMPSDDLNQMILNFIGVDYLKVLEINLEDVKTKLLSIAKPKQSKEDLFNAKVDAKIFLNNNRELLNKNKIILDETNSKLTEIKQSLDDANNELVNIGNIPNIISIKQTKLTEIETFLSGFEIKTKKEKIPFTNEKPFLDEYLIAKLNETNFNNNTLISSNKLTIDEYKEKNIEVIANLNILKERIIKEFETSEININSDIDKINDANILLTNAIVEYINGYITKFESKITEVESKITELKIAIETNETTISNNIKSIESGICSECKRPFSEDYESHKQNLLDQNNKLLIENENIETDKIKQSELLVQLKTFKTNYSSYRDLIIGKNYSETLKINISKIHTDLEKQYINIEENLKLIKTKNQLISEINLSKLNWVSLNETKFTNTVFISNLNSSELNEIINDYNSNNSTIQLLENSNTELLSLINTNNVRIKEIQDNYTSELKTYQTAFDLNISQNNDIDTFNLTVDEYNNSQQSKINEKSIITLEIENLSQISLPLYNKKIEDINIITTSLTELNSKISGLSNDITNLKVEITKNENNLVNAEKNYNDYSLYEKNNLIWNIFSKLIKENFKEIVFEYYRVFLNNTLNVLLEDVYFKLFWNEESDLYMITTKNGQIVYQPVQQSSGMETCFLGLSLVYTIHLLNIKNSISHIFIDELTGTLNKGGNELSYSAINYQELFVYMLNKFTNKSIFIVDHNIKNMFETMVYEVIPTDSGSKYIQKV